MNDAPDDVASYADAWIEMSKAFDHSQSYRVASYADAWIEIISLIPELTHWNESHPTRMRGLKYATELETLFLLFRRILRGCVD